MCNRMSSFIRKICFIKAHTEETDRQTDRQTDTDTDRHRQTTDRKTDRDRKRVNNRR